MDLNSTKESLCLYGFGSLIISGRFYYGLCNFKPLLFIKNNNEKIKRKKGTFFGAWKGLRISKISLLELNNFN